jgi:hypothetical protein
MARRNIQDNHPSVKQSMTETYSLGTLSRPQKANYWDDNDPIDDVKERPVRIVLPNI